MYRFLLPLSLLLSTAMSGQTDPEESVTVVLRALPADHATRVFGDKINVRQAPNKDAAVVDQLTIGEPVTIIAEDPAEMTLNGWTAQWRKIAYTRNGKRREGFAWGGVLSPIALQAGDVSFVYNIVKSTSKKEKGPDGAVYDNPEHDIEIRAVRGGAIASTVRLRLGFQPDYLSEAFLYNHLGLKQYKNVLKFTFHYEACGYTAYDVWCVWDGRQLVQLPVLESASDAGAFFDSETYLFPEVQGGVEGMLLYQHEHGEGMEMDGTYDYTRRLRPMTWNGKAYAKPKLD